MKKALIIFLLLQFASNNSFAEELFRLPALLSHYNHHRAEHHDIAGFSDFLYKHYASQERQDESEHHGLPFKHCTDGCSVSHNVAVCFLPSFNSSLNIYQTSFETFHSEDETINSLDLCFIWQPPKLA